MARTNIAARFALPATALTSMLALGVATASGGASDTGTSYFDTDVTAATTTSAPAAKPTVMSMNAAVETHSESPVSAQVEANRTAVDDSDAAPATMVEKMKAAVANQEYVLTPSNSRLGFASKARVIGTVSGDFQDYLVVVSENADGQIELRSNIKPASVEMTRNEGRRDMLMSEAWFAPQTYPTISYVGDVQLNDSMTAAGGKGMVDGRLVLRGVTNPEDMNLTFSCAGITNCPEAGIKVKGEMTIDRNVYGMTEMGRLVEDGVVIDIDGTLSPR